MKLIYILHMNINSGASDRRSFWVSCFIWAVCVALYFSPVLFAGKVLAPMDIWDCVFRPYATQPIEQVHNQFVVDAISQYLPYNYSVAQSFQQDGYMGWNPYTHNGSAMAANTMICPGDWHHGLYAFLPFWRAWDLGIILQFFIAGLGMIVFLRQQKLSGVYGLLGGISYGFYSQFVFWLYHRWVLGAMCWGPWILWALLRNKKKQVIDVPSIIFIALGFRGGHLQACLFIVLLVACVWMVDWWQRPNKWSLKVLVMSSLPYWVSGLLACVLSLDVLAHTVPPLLEGCKSLPMMLGYTHLPSLITMVFPTLGGIPETIDLFKVMGQDLFDLKFCGGVMFILGVLGLFNKKAPVQAKVLMVISLLVAFTPLLTYFYSRSTAVYAIGCAWLAVWELKFLSEAPQQVFWKKWFVALGIIISVWLFCSLALAVFHQELAVYCQNLLGSHVGAKQMGRTEWMMLRVERLLAQLCIWDWRNLLLLVLLCSGLWAASRIYLNANYKKWWLAAVVICTFGEQLVVQTTWITYASQPAGNTLYPEQDWIVRLKAHVGEGSVSFISKTGGQDYLHTNHLSTFGIKQAAGYETVTPKRLQALNNFRDPEDAAQAAISHIIVAPEDGMTELPGWRFIEHTDQYTLFANPAYKGRCFAGHDDMKTAIRPNFVTANRMDISVPSGMSQLSVLESYSPGWKALLNGKEMLPVNQSERGGMVIPLPASGEEMHVLLQYRDPNQNLYNMIMGGTLGLLLLVGGCKLWKGRKRKEQAPAC